MNLKELLEKRMKAVTAARSILDKAQADGRATLLNEEKEAYDKAYKEVNDLGETIERETRQMEFEAKLKESVGRSVPPGAGEEKPAEKLQPRRKTSEYRAMFNSFLRGGFRGFGPAETRALQLDSDVIGGYLVPPEEFVDNLIIAVKNLVFMRQLATTHTVTGAKSLGIPALDVDISAPVWTTEVAAANEDTSMEFGKRELIPHPLAKLIRISSTLLQRTAGGAEAIVQDRLAYQFAITQENAFLNGNGVQQPLGVFVASSQGINTDRDVQTTESAGILPNDLITLKYSLKQQYQNSPTLKWLMHRTVAQYIMQMKDSYGRYMWQPSIQLGQPDMLLNVPIIMSEYAPNTFTSGQYIAMLGDFSWYHIADVQGEEGLTVQRLDELYAVNNQVGFIGRTNCDGMPVLEEAFARLILE